MLASDIVASRIGYHTEGKYYTVNVLLRNRGWNVAGLGSNLRSNTQVTIIGGKHVSLTLAQTHCLIHSLHYFSCTFGFGKSKKKTSKLFKCLWVSILCIYTRTQLWLWKASKNIISKGTVCKGHGIFSCILLTLIKFSSPCLIFEILHGLMENCCLKSNPFILYFLLPVL